LALDTKLRAGNFGDGSVTSPAVSVVMPVYNSERYLRLAVQSILDQTFQDFEFIVVDDGSRDSSLAILREYEAKDPRVRIISRGNTGIVGALNDGLEASRGELIARMDADDISQPDRLAKQVPFLQSKDDHVLVGCQVMLIDPDGAELCPKRDTEYTHERIDWAHLNHRWPLVHPTVLMRKSAVEQVGRYRQRYQWLEDLDLFLRLAEMGRIASLPDVLLRYRLHTESVCATREADQDAIRPALIAEVYQRRRIPGPTAPIPRYDSGRTLGSPGQRDRVWGWWALQGGNINTARKYAFRSLRATPLTLESWRLMYCALRGR
jgi:glycosyltransferase involved in cell wall biosynthesis